MSNEVTSIVESTQLDLWIMGWLHEKGTKTNSKKTVKAYRDTIDKFRLMLKQANLDLDSISSDEYGAGLTMRQALRLKAQEFSSYSERGVQVKPATVEQRLAVLSSFYEYAVRQEYLLLNPIKMIDRPKVPDYQTSKALTQEQTLQGLESIDREMPRGKRDYAIICVLLSTGRRVSEVANLERKDLHIDSRGKITVTFLCKGNKLLTDDLPEDTSKAVLEWLREYYGSDINKIDPHVPLWINLSPRKHGSKLDMRSFSNICEKYFGTGKVHAMRHTWTVNMLKEGANLQLIRQKLGHSSLETTGIYAASLEQNENPFAERVAKRAGIK
jgi:site-specific recombinase XerD